MTFCFVLHNILLFWNQDYTETELNVAVILSAQQFSYPHYKKLV